MSLLSDGGYVQSKYYNRGLIKNTDNTLDTVKLRYLAIIESHRIRVSQEEIASLNEIDDMTSLLTYVRDRVRHKKQLDCLCSFTAQFSGMYL